MVELVESVSYCLPMVKAEHALVEADSSVWSTKGVVQVS